MCLAIPAQILEIDPTSDNAIVSLGGVRKPVSLALVEGAAVGDYVLVHVGYALNRISPEEAERTLALIQQAGEFDPLEFESDLDADPEIEAVLDAGADIGANGGTASDSEPHSASGRELRQ